MMIIRQTETCDHSFIQVWRWKPVWKIQCTTAGRTCFLTGYLLRLIFRFIWGLTKLTIGYINNMEELVSKVGLW